MASMDLVANGRGDSDSGRTVRVCEGSRLLNGRCASRWSKVREESAEVIWESRVANGGEFGAGTVRARAMLQAFAPRSRTLGKCRLIS